MKEADLSVFAGFFRGYSPSEFAAKITSLGGPFKFQNPARGELIRTLSIFGEWVLVCAVLSSSAFASSLQTIVGCFIGPASGTVSFTSPDNGLPSTISWTAMGHVNGPTDMGAYMSASYTNYAPGSQGDFFYFFAEQAVFSDMVSFTGSTAPIFNFSIHGTSSASNINYADWQMYLWFTKCYGSPPCGPTGGIGPINNGNFSVGVANSFSGSGLYELWIQLNARVCLFGCLGYYPAAGTNLSGTADYNSTLTLDSVTLAPGETMIGESGINYGNLHPVPEPGGLALVFTGIAGLVGARRSFRC